MAKSTNTPQDRGPYFIIDNDLPTTHPYGKGRGFYVYEAKKEPELLNAAGIKPQEVDLEQGRLKSVYWIRIAAERLGEQGVERRAIAEITFSVEELKGMARWNGYWDERAESDPDCAAKVIDGARAPPLPAGITNWKQIPGYDQGVKEYRAWRKVRSRVSPKSKDDASNSSD